jgi:hypothetical protein
MLPQGGRAVIYARVSTSSQTAENQNAELREVAMRNAWHVALELTDSGISGKARCHDRTLPRRARADFGFRPLPGWQMAELNAMLRAYPSALRRRTHRARSRLKLRRA